MKQRLSMLVAAAVTSAAFAVHAQQPMKKAAPPAKAAAPAKRAEKAVTTAVEER